MATSLAGGYTVCGAPARGATRVTLSPGTGNCQGDQPKRASKSEWQGKKTVDSSIYGYSYIHDVK